MNPNKSLTESKFILHLNDDKSLSENYAFLNFSEGFRISKVNVQEGLKKLAQDKIAAVILDSLHPDIVNDVIDKIEKTKPDYPVFVYTDELNIKIYSTNTSVYNKSKVKIEELYNKVYQHLKTDVADIKKAKIYNGHYIEKPVCIPMYVEGESGYVFAFKLQKFLLKNEAVYIKWHRTLSETLAKIDVEVKIYRLIFKRSGKVEVYFAINLPSTNRREAHLKFDKLFTYISYFFNNENLDNPVLATPVYSLPVLNKIKNYLGSLSSSNAYLFLPDVFDFEKPQPINGFLQREGKAPAGETAIALPRQKTGENYDDLFKSIYNEKDTCLVSRIGFYTADSSFINQVKRIKTEMKNAYLTMDSNELKSYLTYIDKLEKDKNFITERHVLLTKSSIPHVLISKISKLLYNNNCQVDTSKLDAPDSRFVLTYDDFSATGLLPVISKTIRFSFESMLPQEQNISAGLLKDEGVAIGMHQKGKVYLEQKQFQKHTYLIGKTGMGKTSILYTMLMDRIWKGYGVALIDPHGDLFKLVYKNVPGHRRKDIVIYNPTDITNDFGFNLLHYDRNFPEQQSFVIGELMDVFASIYDLKAVGGPMFELFFTNAMKLIMEVLGDKATLLDFERYFYDSTFRSYILFKSKNKRSREILLNLEKQHGEHSFEDFAPYITSKINRITENYFIKRTICDPDKNVDFRDLIDSNKILLVSLNQGRMGKEAVRFVGRMLSNQIFLAAYTREDIPENQRKDFTLFIDEFQNFTGKNVIAALSEMRKYRLQLVLANQNFEQLDDQMVNTILANAGSLIAGAVAPKDAERIAPFFQPDITKEAIVQMDSFKFLVATQLNKRFLKPFMVSSIPYDE